MYRLSLVRWRHSDARVPGPLPPKFSRWATLSTRWSAAALPAAQGLLQEGTAAERQPVLLLVVGLLAGPGGLGGQAVPEGGVGVGD